MASAEAATDAALEAIISAAQALGDLDEGMLLQIKSKLNITLDPFTDAEADTLRALFDNTEATSDEKAAALNDPISLIKTAANAVHQFDNPPDDLAAPETLLSAQSDADASQLAAVASIEAAAESALQVTLAAEANNLVAAKNYTVAVSAKAGAAAREAARVEAATEDLLSAKAAATAAYNQALAAKADAVSSETAAQSRLSDVRATISSAEAAKQVPW